MRMVKAMTAQHNEQNQYKARLKIYVEYCCWSLGSTAKINYADVKKNGCRDRSVNLSVFLFVFKQNDRNMYYAYRSGTACVQNELKFQPMQTKYTTKWKCVREIGVHVLSHGAKEDMAQHLTIRSPNSTFYELRLFYIFIANRNYLYQPFPIVYRPTEKFHYDYIISCSM